MPLLVWNNTYSVGIKEIDEQHQKIFELLNKLYTLMDESKDEASLPQFLKELEDYAKYHFSTEEKYFEEFNYPEKENHKTIHASYVEKVSQFRKDYEDKKSTLSFELLDFLEDWLLQHINVTDKRYTQCFHDHGLY